MLAGLLVAVLLAAAASWVVLYQRQRALEDSFGAQLRAAESEIAALAESSRLLAESTDGLRSELSGELEQLGVAIADSDAALEQVRVRAEDARTAAAEAGQRAEEVAAETDPASIARGVLPSLVTVQIEREGGRFSNGSGFAVDVAGASQWTYVLTNHHVVDEVLMRSPDDPVVWLARDGKAKPGKVVSWDAGYDLALVEVGWDLPRLPLGDVGAAEAGELVVAAGSPFGYRDYVTSGVLSQREQVRLLHTAGVNPAPRAARSSTAGARCSA